MLDPGGAERQMVLLAEHLPRPRFDVRFILLSERGLLAESVEALGVRVDVLGLPRGCSPFHPRCALAAIGALRRYRAIVRNVDVVDAWLAPALTFATAARPFARPPVLLGGRRWLTDLYRSKPWYRRAITSASARLADAVVTNSAAAARELVDHDGVQPEKVRVIPNAVLPATSSVDDRLAARAMWDAREGDLVVGCVANLKPEKGHQTMLTVAAAMRRSRPNVRFVFVGGGQLRQQLARAIERDGLRGMVWLHGAEPDARRLYGAFDIVVQASDSEGLPNVVLEAAAAGLPIVATAVGGTGEIVTDEVDGLLVRPRDANAMREALERLFDDPALRARLGAAAQRRAGDFSPERLVDATGELYESLLDQALKGRSRPSRSS
jgi:glycosyltransferase involved in cell wall biosynthesis